MSRWEEIKQVAEKRTKGKWFDVGSAVSTDPTKYPAFPPSKEVIASLDDSEYIANKNAINDAAFITVAANKFDKIAAVVDAAKNISPDSSVDSWDDLHLALEALRNGEG